ncbi:MAG: hypothetical protein COW03_17965 [Cytophagales bacterium CG12_big_fil_rev_8_21_14_0_65_40_12]|nr:MAG: hypothetical protein COW03_17965 [Cytophagales bacterium CG12_big_fil_rev_8_21_14_0_65_40_12]PIW06213.1 MAG: hypothetical protein COW40_00715 [Cytophagales bacterium CG17_big_fil_post_rev_8_21_14_2_50_40_13]
MRTLIVCFFILIGVVRVSKAQVGVSIHQTNIPFVGVNYQIKDNYIAELRLGTDNFFENIGVEGVITRVIKRDEDFQFYGGLGVRLNTFQGLIIPVGLNLYPFENKQFGFHMELAGMIVDEGELLRATWGIRYRFKKKDGN